MIDQTLLPTEFKEIDCWTVEGVWEAIKVLRVRGAPAIGVAAAYGVVVGLKDHRDDDRSDFNNKLAEVAAYLASSRLGAEIRQPVDPGDASETVESEVVFVSLPVGRGLVGKVSLSSSVLTPNGDGIGDRLEVEFDLLKVLEPRPVRGAIYDL